MKKIWILLAVLLVSVSCQDFFETSSESTIEGDELFESEDMINLAINGIYSYYTSESLYGSRYIKSYRVNTDVEFQDTQSKDAVSVKGDDVGSYEVTPSWGDPYNTWTTTYQAFNYANKVVKGIEESELFARTGKSAPSKLMQMYGEAKCLRAILIFDLLRIWGDVPFTFEPSDVENMPSLGAVHRDTIMTRLIDDLILVEPLMQAQSEVQYGPLRATRSLCQGLIAEIALTRGGWALRPVENTTSSYIGEMVRTSDAERAYYYDLAAKYAGKAIKEGNHKLTLSFEDLWYKECNWETPTGDDIVFDVSFLKHGRSEIAYELGEKIDEGTHPYGKASGSNIFSIPYVLSFDSKDLRRMVTCQFHSVGANLDQAAQMGITKTRCGKWSKLKMKEPLGATSGKGTGVAYPWMRYAEILLMYAEAVNELQGPGAAMHDCPITAAEALKQVRRRAFATTDHGEKVETYVNNLTASTDPSDRNSFFSAIVDERAWELGGENKRKHDLARWNLYTTKVRGSFYDMLKMGMETQSTLVPNTYTYSRNYAYIPDNIGWKLIDDPKGLMAVTTPARVRKVIDMGNSLSSNVNAAPAGGSATSFCKGMWSGAEPSAGGVPTDALRRGYRGFIYWDTATKAPVEATNEVRYLMPIPERVILLHKGELKNNYGY